MKRHDPVDIDDTLLRAWPLPQPHARADKSDRGTLLVVAGSAQMPGGAVLAAEAALRAGAGRVVIATVTEAAASVAAAVPEARVIGLRATAEGGIAADGAAEALARQLERADALLVGPAMLDEAATVALACALRMAAPALPVVLDAAAIAAADVDVPGCPPPLITPHAGEMARATGDAKPAVQAEPVDCAAEAAQRLPAYVALKGAHTVIAAPDGRLWQHHAVVPGLGTAGSGDVLAGVIAGLAARGAPLEQAAAWGVALHARAGQRLADRIGPIGFLARELAAELPALLAELRPGP
jgi:hydroxyethylthiazole kinase-like uncharacterized protein yjeF